MNFGKTMRKFRRNMRAISPVIATLLMIAIAVVASLVTYAWVMGYMNFTTEKTGKAIQIQSVSYNNNTKVFTVYVQNVGDSDLQFASGSFMYINGALANPQTITAGTTGSPATLSQGNTATISGTQTTLLAGVQSVTIKITTLDGTFSQNTQQFTIT
jgi:archaeal type IV pilus assembly protein PilA